MKHTTISETLAAFCHSLDFADLPANAVEMAKLALLDWLGSVIRGGDEKVPALMGRTFGAFSCPQESTVINDRRKSSCMAAVMLNGAAAHTLQLSDIHKGVRVGSSFWGSSVHPSIPVITPAFAIAERERNTGRELITAIVLGYEVIVRIAEAVFPSHQDIWNPTGTCGAFASAAAAGKLLKLDQDQMTSAIGAAGLQAAGLWEGVSQGCICSEFVSGKASMNGIIAALLAREGFAGPREILEGTQGFFSATSANCDASRVVHNLGSCLDDFKIMSTSFKVHAACGHTHSAIDAVLAIKAREQFNIQDIEKVRVRMYPRAIEFLNGVKAEDPQSAQYCLEFCIASALRDGAVTLASFSVDRLGDLEIRELMSKISVESEKEFQKSFPEKWIAAAEITMKNGKRCDSNIEYPKGHPKNPLSRKEIVDKFFAVTDQRIPRGEAERLKANVMDIEQITDMGSFLVNCGLSEKICREADDGA